MYAPDEDDDDVFVDIHAEMDLLDQDADVIFDEAGWEPCHLCSGSGVTYDSGTCPWCMGAGEVRTDYDDDDDYLDD